MRFLKRSEWYHWTCDLEGCTVTDTTHPVLDPNGRAEIPSGWVIIDPPKFWKGPSLAFCGPDHRNEWAQVTVGPLLLGDGTASGR